jgi:hypothetical protein
MIPMPPVRSKCSQLKCIGEEGEGKSALSISISLMIKGQEYRICSIPKTRSSCTLLPATGYILQNLPHKTSSVNLTSCKRSHPIKDNASTEVELRPGAAVAQLIVLPAYLQSETVEECIEQT